MISVPIWLCIVIALICAAVCAGIAFLLGIEHRKKEAESAIGSAEQEAKRIVSDAIKTAEARKKEVVLEGKDEIHRQRTEAERELNERRKEVQRQERRVQQKEETLDKKIESLETKEEAVAKKNKQAEERLAEAESVKKSQFEMLERISGFTVDQAKEYMLKMRRPSGLCSLSRKRGTRPKRRRAKSFRWRSRDVPLIMWRRRPSRLCRCRTTR